MKFSLLAPVLLLAACGYTPLYAPNMGAAQAAQKAQVGEVTMAKTAKNVGERRVAQLVSQRLQLAFPHQSADADTITVDILEDTSTLALSTTAATRRAQINLEGTVIITTPQGKQILNTKLTTTAPYNVENTPYATESGKTYARLNAARTLADEITRRLALFYRTQTRQNSQ